MPFQKVVNRYRAAGVAGQAATPDQSIYTAKNYLSDGTVQVGCFAFAGEDEGTAAASGSSLLGLVERNVVYPIYDVSDTAMTVPPKSCALTIAVRGDYYVESTTAASVGDAVYASSTDGSISCGSGDVETGWIVKDALEAGDTGGLVLISNWTAEATTGGSGSGGTTSFDLSKATGTLSVAHGGTGATSAEAARTALGLGDLATEDAPLAISKGGTGATSADDAKTNLDIKAVAG